MRWTRRALLASAVAASAAKTKRPHIVLFLADDHGRLDTPVYGSRVVRTPALSRIAAGGMVFENCFTGAAICIPSRAIIGSGLCSHRNGAIANGRPMNPGVKTLPAYLSEVGYRVAHFGKGHFLPAPNYTGWEAVPSEIKGEGVLNVDLDTAAFDRWLNGAAGGEKPLCLIVCCHSPHVAWEENVGYDPATVDLPPGFIETPETRAARCRYYTDVTKMDRQLGEVYAAVRRHLGDNALFVYTSDNGPQWPFGKWTLYDAGIRMPMVASWPGIVRGGTRTKAMVHFTDILPTFLELAGGTAPSGIDGQSFAGVLRGKASRHRNEIFAAHTADDNGHMNCYPMRAVRDERYKYIRNLRVDLAYRTHIDRGVARDGRGYWDSWLERAKTDAKAMAVVSRYHKRPEEELYDTWKDPHELVNLAADPKHRARLVAMRARVTGWMESMSDTGEIFGVPRPLSKEGLIAS